MRKILLYFLDCVLSSVRSRAVLQLEVSVANWYSRGDREFEKATAMLFPSEIAQRGRMCGQTAAHFRRRVSAPANSTQRLPALSNERRLSPRRRLPTHRF